MQYPTPATVMIAKCNKKETNQTKNTGPESKRL
jgi:hypothetical protein